MIEELLAKIKAAEREQMLAQQRLVLEAERGRRQPRPGKPAIVIHTRRAGRDRAIRERRAA